MVSETHMRDCPTCQALLVECGEEHFPLYSRKLLKRGWAGRKSRVERAYIRAHRARSEAQLGQDARLGKAAHPRPSPAA